MHNVLTIADILYNHAVHKPDKTAFTFLVDGEAREQSLTFKELDNRAGVLSVLLNKSAGSGDRAVLLYPSGPAYLAAFFGCLYSGIIAVPLYPPKLKRRGLDTNLSRLKAIIHDSTPRVALTTAGIYRQLAPIIASYPELNDLQWIVTDHRDVKTQYECPQQVPMNHTAFLQYTSGSTGNPKGVMVSHKNIIANQQMMKEFCNHSDKTVFMTWLPLYHDMGLIGNIMHPLYLGVTCYFMEPTHFLQKPLRWLQAISQYQVTTSGGPNFAYDLCVEKISETEKAALDLSSWQIAFNGAEPVRHTTLTNFYNAFKECGFSSRAFYPCYGLAEATLMVAGKGWGNDVGKNDFRAERLEPNMAVETATGEHSTRTLVSCGNTTLNQEIIIVDPEYKKMLPDGMIGEIWIKGDNVAKGYWNNPEQTEQVFHASMVGRPDELFLRTGDVGFFEDGRMYITGRLKDLIIIRGKNYYPQDIELTVESVAPILNNNCGAAFSIDEGGIEELIIVQEIHRHYKNIDLPALITRIKQAVSTGYELEIKAVVLIKTGTIPRTTSGKIQRRKTKQLYRDNKLAVIHVWEHKNVVHPGNTAFTPAPSEQTQLFTVDTIRDWLIQNIAHTLKISPESIDVTVPFDTFGLNSAQIIGLTGELAIFTGLPVNPALVYTYPDIISLSAYLADPHKNARESSLLDEPGTSRPEGEEPIAIIGMACRLPGAADLDQYWELLSTGTSGIVPINKQRAALFDRDKGKSETGSLGLLDDIDLFDADFFGVSPLEAHQMDPQQRILMELSYLALEDAGIDTHTLKKSKTGVFLGLSTNDYGRMVLENPDTINAYAVTGNGLGIAAGRIAYKYGLTGPAMVIDTACSSSLTAFHQACRSIRRGESTMALVGGANVILSPHCTLAMERTGILSPDSCCRPFDAGANGTVRGEGAGIVILKSLAQAERDHDAIYAVVRGSAINQDGRSNGLMAPNRNAQEQLLKDVYHTAQIDPGSVSYIETHGTGTLLGDPIEAGALGTLFALSGKRRAPCTVGSVKSNIGHLEAAAGIASIIKTTLMIHHKKIVPSLNYTKPNPYINFEQAQIAVATGISDWRPYPGNPTVTAGINCFGIGGTNVHVILQDYVQKDALPVNPPVDTKPLLFVLSAYNKPALQALAGVYQDYVSGTAHMTYTDLYHMCYSLSIRRTHFMERLAIVFTSPSELADRLQAFMCDSNGRCMTTDRNDHVSDTARSFINGRATDFSKLYKHTAPCYIRLPRYPYQRESYWLTPGVNQPETIHKNYDPIISLVEKQSRLLPIDLNLPSYQVKWDFLTALSGYYIIKIFDDCRIFKKRTITYSMDDIVKQTSITPEYRHLIRRWLNRLIKEGYVAEKKKGFIRLRKFPAYRYDNLMKEGVRLFADIEYMYDYITMCGSNLLKVITGRMSALETLFPGGSYRIADNLYTHWPVAHYFNTIAAEVVKALFVFLQPAGKVNILEIGGGTGGTTASILKVLPAEKTDYHFTDISDFFFNRNRQKFNEYNCITYQPLNIEHDPRDQGFNPGTYDIIIAANVIHAVKDIDKAMKHIQSLLSENGILILNEVTDHKPWFDISVGLIEGWNRFEDTVRKSNPLLSADDWQKLLLKYEFSRVRSFPAEDLPTRILGQHVIVGFKGETLSVCNKAIMDTGRKPADNDAGEKIEPGIACDVFPALPDVKKRAFLDTYFQTLLNRIFKVSDHTFHKSTELLDLGVDSLIALELKNRLETDFSLTLSVANFLEGMTIADLEEYIIEETRSTAVPGSIHNDFDAPVINYLTPRCERNNRRPFFCITGGYGDLYALKELARPLAEKQPFYQLQPPLKDNEIVFNDICELARFYCSRITAVQPDGPYLLGGYCGGGILAFEVARQFERQNKVVEFLALFDAPYNFNARSLFLYGTAQKILKKVLPDIHKYRSKTLKKFLSFFYDRGNEAHIIPITGYKPEKYHGKITLFQPRLSPFRLSKAKALWQRAAEGGLNYHQLQGDHFNFLRPPHSSKLSALLREYFDRFD